MTIRRTGWTGGRAPSRSLPGRRAPGGPARGGARAAGRRRTDRPRPGCCPRRRPSRLIPRPPPAPVRPAGGRLSAPRPARPAAAAPPRPGRPPRAAGGRPGPPWRSASCASTVVNRSSTSRTGSGASRAASAAANALASAAARPSRPDRPVGRPTIDLDGRVLRGQGGQRGPGRRGRAARWPAGWPAGRPGRCGRRRSGRNRRRRQAGRPDLARACSGAAGLARG